jgi:RNA polymerase sigma-70 factor (ECF subfamily)
VDGLTELPAPAPVTGRADGRDPFGEWVRPHWDSMARLARRLSPASEWEDVLQESLSAAWRKRSQFDPDRGTPRNWLLAIVADQARKGRRRIAARPDAQVEDAAAEAGDSASDLDMERAVTRLTGRQQSAVALYYYLGLPVADVAAVMACSPGTVKSTLADARLRLRRELGEDYR